MARGRTMILPAGSGRATDAVLAARAGRPVKDTRLVEIARTGKITAWNIHGDPASLRELVQMLLFDRPQP